MPKLNSKPQYRSQVASPKKTVPVEDMILTPGVRGFLDYLESSGDIDTYNIIPSEGDVGSIGRTSTGTFDFDDVRRINIVSSDTKRRTNDAAHTAAHEGIHALNIFPKRTGRARQIVDQLKELSQERSLYDIIFGQKVVPPSHWTNGNFEDPFVVTPVSFGYSYPEIDKGITDTIKHIKTTVHDSMPDGISWSGLGKDKYVNMSEKHESGQEALARYLTDQDIKLSSQQKRKNLGLHLRDKGLPWDTIEGLLNDLGLGRESVRKNAN